MQKTYKKETGFGSIELIIVLLIVGAIGAAGFFIYQTKMMIVTSTECFSISVPKEWQIDSTSNKCFFGAYSGSDIKNSDSTVIIIPYTSKMPSLKAAETKLVEGLKNINKADGQTKIGGNDAVYISGPSNNKQAARYIVISPKSYSPTAKDYTTNAFSITVETPENDKRTSSKIINSITWH